MQNPGCRRQIGINLEWLDVLEKTGCLVGLGCECDDQAGNPREWPIIRASEVRFVGGKRESSGMEAGFAS